VVLEHTRDDVDFISCHAYYQERDGDRGSFLASAVDMDAFIEAVIATADSVTFTLRSERMINISFDEWNVWYSDHYNDGGKITGVETWPYAPRLLEDQYSVTDAVVVGSLLICLLRHADRVKAACLAQLVNVIAPIMTEPGGPAWRQAIFFPFAITARLAQGRVLRLAVESPSYETAEYGTVPLVDAVATMDDDGGDVAVFLVHRSLDAPTTVSINVSSLGPVRLGETITLADDDPTATNTLEHPERVAPTPNRSGHIENGVLTIELPAISWTALQLVSDLGGRGPDQTHPPSVTPNLMDHPTLRRTHPSALFPRAMPATPDQRCANIPRPCQRALRAMGHHRVRRQGPPRTRAAALDAAPCPATLGPAASDHADR
jgi:alpha-N-arabinofuranosidase